MPNDEPQLLFLALCARAIIDHEGAVSLIDVIEGIQSETPGPDIDPALCYSDKPLFAVSFWQGSLVSGIEAMQQRLRIFDPAGKFRTGGKIVDIATQTVGHKVIQRIPAFPIGLEGMYSVKLEWRFAGKRHWRTAATYLVNVTHGSRHPSELRPD